MRYLVVALALSFALAPMEAAASDFHSARTVQVKAKAKKNKVKTRKPPKKSRRAARHV